MSLNQSERHFSRIPFDAETNIVSIDDNQKWPCTLLDISLHGALTSRPANWPAQCGDDYKLILQLGSEHDEDLRLHMDVRVTHMENDHVGFEIIQMDIDTANHLRRLVELNVGDEDILQRNLAELIKQHTHT
ncbi:MAG: PilZ domain-containing protein [Gammaproteobacteria bacterium]|nr:PilZ domain-containing protein [Gammaproteobacteria bacterium]